MYGIYGIYGNIGGILMVNVTIYSIHGSYVYLYTWSQMQKTWVSQLEGGAFRPAMGGMAGMAGLGMNLAGKGQNGSVICRCGVIIVYYSGDLAHKNGDLT